MGFQILTAASMKTAVIWAVGLCGLIETCRHSKDACCILHEGDHRRSIRLHEAILKKTFIFINTVMFKTQAWKDRKIHKRIG